MRKIIAIFLIFLFLFTCLFTASSGMKVWPGKIWISINNWYDEDDNVDRTTIEVTNTESDNMTVTIRVENPDISTIDEGYSAIPDVSWVKFTPEILDLKGYEKGEIEVYIQVPESEQLLYNNEERWETRVIVSPPIDSGGGINVQTELGVRLFIRTPSGEAEQNQYIPFVLIAIFLIALLLGIFYNKKKKLGKFQKNK